MIQRIQTLFMLLFVLIGGGNFFLFPLEAIVFEPILQAESSLSPYVSLILSFVVLINIGLFKNRLLQMRINQLVWVLFTLFWCGFVYLCIQYQTNGLSQFLPDVLLAFIGEVSLLLANYYIRKDQALIRSLDRLR